MLLRSIIWHQQFNPFMGVYLIVIIYFAIRKSFYWYSFIEIFLEKHRIWIFLLRTLNISNKYTSRLHHIQLVIVHQI